ncbi:heterokaryon incompatibility protein, partial [Cladorrhinum sp. PSN332]
LSHRWGRKPRHNTLQADVERFQDEIPPEAMPPTFKNATEVTRQLGFRYLWIDSLCIVQDEPIDRSNEIPKIGDIFESSTCNIAAVDSLD